MSELRADTITASNGTSPVTLTKQSAAKAWASWNSTTTLQDSLNISSLTDSSTGVTVHNFSSSFSNALFSTSGSHDRIGGNINSFLVNAFATTSVTTSTYTNAGAIDASVLASSNIHGDLA